MIRRATVRKNRRSLIARRDDKHSIFPPSSTGSHYHVRFNCAACATRYYGREEWEVGWETGASHGKWVWQIIRTTATRLTLACCVIEWRDGAFSAEATQRGRIRSEWKRIRCSEGALARERTSIWEMKYLAQRSSWKVPLEGCQGKFLYKVTAALRQRDHDTRGVFNLIECMKTKIDSTPRACGNNRLI